MKRLQAKLLATAAAFASVLVTGRKGQRDLMGKSWQPPTYNYGRHRSEQPKKMRPRAASGRNLSRILARRRKDMTLLGERVIIRTPRRYEKPHPKVGKFHHAFCLL